MPRPTWGHVSDERGENEEDARGDGVTWHVATQRTGCGHVSTKWQPGSWSADPWLCKNIFVDILVDMFVDMSVEAIPAWLPPPRAGLISAAAAATCI